jgi:uncharacterized membrane protein YdjX (TVP38/TMEM64 family)
VNVSHRRLGALAVLGVAAAVGLVVVSPRAVFVSLATVDVRLLAAVSVPLLLVRAFLLVPVTLVTVFVGYRFGFPLGVPLALAATILTCVPPYAVAAWFRGDGALGRVGDWGARTLDHVGGVRGTVAARLSPAPADVVSYGAGVSGVSFRQYVAGTLVGELPWATGYVFLGSALSRVAYDADVDYRYLILAGAVAVVLVARPIYRAVTAATSGTADGDDPELDP